ncbi:MAG: TIGR01777 family oxidoreductase [Candidatus Handelsmanbacteria bacterium]|nr:TIGR01777 family oxidoreductase [Candidatus Handelsmanbacteria bacterium]
MRVLVSGAGGLIGAALIGSLRHQRHEVRCLTRGKTSGSDIPWDPEAGRLDAGALEGLDGVVHLAGENIAGGRWTPARKERILSSRVQGTHLLSERLAGLHQPPPVLLCASAVGYYGDRGEEVLEEDSPPGQGFLAEVCRAWEGAADPVRGAGIRVAHLRFGMVLSARGGALARMLLPFRMGLGGRLGSGNQYLSWIHIDDAVLALIHLLEHPGLSGPFNATSPRPCTNADFTQALGKALRRPTPFPAPAWVLRLALGEMAEELLLASTRTRPARLLASGFRFEHPELEESLRHLLTEGMRRAPTSAQEKRP